MLVHLKILPLGRLDLLYRHPMWFPNLWFIWVNWERFDSPTYLIVLPMTYPFLLVNCSYGEGRHIGEIEADLKYKYSIDNLKLDLVTDPSSFRMAMSFSSVCGCQYLWISTAATLNVLSSVSPSLPIKVLRIDTFGHFQIIKKIRDWKAQSLRKNCHLFKVIFSKMNDEVGWFRPGVKQSKVWNCVTPINAVSSRNDMCFRDKAASAKGSPLATARTGRLASLGQSSY